MTATEKPTIVLVHGAFADASGWAGVIGELRVAGYDRIVAPPNPLRSLSGDADAIARVVRAISGPVLLVGHSYGGAVITQASAGLDNVTALVYLAAFGIEVGESCASSTESFPPALLASNVAPSPYDAPGTPGGPDLYINPDNFREVFAADVPAATADVMNISQRPLSAAAFTEPATAAGWHEKPSFFLVSAQDNSIPPDAERSFAKRMGATTEEINGSHTAFVARPAEVARFILRAG
jgi:pimeloyl-ACP methyl ester carboxylesterase